MNIVKSLVDYLEDSGVATFGQDMFVSRAPSSNTKATNSADIPQNLWWLVSSGGSRDGLLDTYNVDIHYRDRDAECVYEKLQSLRDNLTCAGCVELEGFEVVSIEVTGFFTDQDIDDEERTVGLLQVTITAYQSCVS